MRKGNIGLFLDIWQGKQVILLIIALKIKKLLWVLQNVISVLK